MNEAGLIQKHMVKLMMQIMDSHVFQEGRTCIRKNPFSNQLIYGRGDPRGFERDQLKGEKHVTTPDQV